MVAKSLICTSHSLNDLRCISTYTGVCMLFPIYIYFNTSAQWWQTDTRLGGYESHTVIRGRESTYERKYKTQMKDWGIHKEYIFQILLNGSYTVLHGMKEKRQKTNEQKQRQKTLLNVEEKLAALIVTKENKGKRGETLNCVDATLGIAQQQQK